MNTNIKTNAKPIRLTEKAEEIIFELECPPGSIKKNSLEELVDAFAIVEGYKQDILYVRGATPADVFEQIENSCEIIAETYQLLGNIIRKLNIVFYFGDHVRDKRLIYEVEQTFTQLLREATAVLGVEIYRTYYNANENLKLRYNCALVIDYNYKQKGA